MTKYILIAEAMNDTNEYVMAQLASKPHPDLKTAEIAVNEALGHPRWELLELSQFCDRWNDSTGWDGPAFDPNSSYAAIIEIGA
jgi:hypothetical protein